MIVIIHSYCCHMSISSFLTNITNPIPLILHPSIVWSQICIDPLLKTIVSGWRLLSLVQLEHYYWYMYVQRRVLIYYSHHQYHVDTINCHLVPLAMVIYTMLTIFIVITWLSFTIISVVTLILKHHVQYIYI